MNKTNNNKRKDGRRHSDGPQTSSGREGRRRKMDSETTRGDMSKTSMKQQNEREKERISDMK